MRESLSALCRRLFWDEFNPKSMQPQGRAGMVWLTISQRGDQSSACITISDTSDPASGEDPDECDIPHSLTSDVNALQQQHLSCR